jgi:subtilisin-like proprotein convertase family protein
MSKTYRFTTEVSLLLVVVALVAQALSPAPASAATQTFTNPTPLTIPASATGSNSKATTYPSFVNVSGMPGPITDVNVTLHRVGHPDPPFIGVLLVSPSGHVVNLMSGNCDDPIDGFTWIFDQQSANRMPQLRSGDCPDFVYRPNPQGRTFLQPAPAAQSTSLDHFNGRNANGTWSLYFMDCCYAGGGQREIKGGWSLTITTGPYDMAIPGTGTSGTANPYPATRSVSGETGVITDLNVSIDGIWHQRPDDLDLLLVGPQGQKVVLMSDACGTFEVAAHGWFWDDEAPAVMPDGGSTNSCGTTSHRPTDHEPGETWPAPAPSGPYAATLSAFDLTDPNGEWKLFVNDDAGDRVGFFTNRFQLSGTTRVKASVAFTQNAVQIPEGQSRTLTLTRSAPGELGAATVTVTTLPATATSGSDFTPISSVIEFGAGETTKTVQVAALEDDEAEGDETFVVTIGSPTGDAAAADPSSVTVTISAEPDSIAPETTIDKGPKKRTSRPKAKFSFSSDVPDSTFQCRIDKGKWRPCTSPKTYRNLEPGRHLFRVRATDQAGNTDATPAKHRWRIL